MKETNILTVSVFVIIGKQGSIPSNAGITNRLPSFLMLSFLIGRGNTLENLAFVYYLG